MRFPFALIATMAVTLGMPGRTAAMAPGYRATEREWADGMGYSAHISSACAHRTAPWRGNVDTGSDGVAYCRAGTVA